MNTYVLLQQHTCPTKRHSEYRAAYIEWNDVGGYMEKTDTSNTHPFRLKRFDSFRTDPHMAARSVIVGIILMNVGADIIAVT
jgi:hypothetical protein